MNQNGLDQIVLNALVLKILHGLEVLSMQMISTHGQNVPTKAFVTENLVFVDVFLVMMVLRVNALSALLTAMAVEHACLKNILHQKLDVFTHSHGML